MNSIQVQNLVIKSIQTKDLEYARYAMMLDPLISQALEPSEVRSMADELFSAEKQWLDYFHK